MQTVKEINPQYVLPLDKDLFGLARQFRVPPA